MQFCLTARSIVVMSVFIGALSATAPALAAPFGRADAPFVATLSNHAPLEFGLTVEQAAWRLQTPLIYVAGQPGQEIFLATVTGGHFFPRTDAVFLQFRHGRLTGWKVDRRMTSGF